jgi:hypothetical protein
MLPSVASEKLRSQLLSLPANERAELAQALLESLHGDGEPDAEAAWLTELDRRRRRSPMGPPNSSIGKMPGSGFLID